MKLASLIQFLALFYLLWAAKSISLRHFYSPGVSEMVATAIKEKLYPMHDSAWTVSTTSAPPK